MRKLFVVLAVAGLAFGTISCQKERDCKCKNKNTGAAISVPMKKGKIADQKKDCEKFSNNFQDCGIDLI